MESFHPYTSTKGTRIQQYHKERRALRTETTINNARDFYIGKSLRNLPALRTIGFQANRRLLQVQKLSHDCILSEEAFQKVTVTLTVESSGGQCCLSWRHLYSRPECPQERGHGRPAACSTKAVTSADDKIVRAT